MLDENGGSRTDTMVKLALVAFMSLLSFSVGIFVGKQVSDSDHQRAQLEEEFSDLAHNDAKTQGGHEGHGDVANSGRLTDEDVVSLTEEFMNSEAPGEQDPAQREVASAETHGEDHSTEAGAKTTGGYKKYGAAKGEAVEHQEPAKSQEAQTSAHGSAGDSAHGAAPAKAIHGNGSKDPRAWTSAPSEGSMRVAQGLAPAQDVKEARKPNTVLPSVAGTAVGKYTIQVASYPTESEASGHAAKLKEKGWNAFYVPAEVAGKNWFRVSVGLFTTTKSANEFKAEFLKEANIGSAIVTKIVN